MEEYQYYFLDDEKKTQGPVSKKILMACGITSVTKVWRKGLPQWIPAYLVPELSSEYEADFNRRFMPEGMEAVPPLPSAETPNSGEPVAPEEDQQISPIPVPTDRQRVVSSTDYDNVAADETLRKRHGCVTVLLWWGLIANALACFMILIAILFSGTNEMKEAMTDTELSKGIVVIFAIITACSVSAMILFLRWNKMGVYLVILSCVLLALLNLYKNDTSAAFQSFIPLIFMCAIFCIKASDGKNFFENIGFFGNNGGYSSNNKDADDGYNRQY